MNRTALFRVMGFLWAFFLCDYAASRQQAVAVQEASRHASLGKQYSADYQYEKARDEYLQAMLLDPGNGSYRVEFAHQLYFSGAFGGMKELDESIRLLEKFLRSSRLKEAERARAKVFLAHACWNRSLWHAAEDWLLDQKRAERLVDEVLAGPADDEVFVEASLAKARMLAKQGKWLRVIRVMRAAKQRASDPHANLMIHSYLGWCFMEEGRLIEAYLAFKHCLVASGKIRKAAGPMEKLYYAKIALQAWIMCDLLRRRCLLPPPRPALPHELREHDWTVLEKYGNKFDQVALNTKLFRALLRSVNFRESGRTKDALDELRNVEPEIRNFSFTPGQVCFGRDWEVSRQLRAMILTWMAQLEREVNQRAEARRHLEIAQEFSRRGFKAMTFLIRDASACVRQPPAETSRADSDRESAAVAAQLPLLTLGSSRKQAEILPGAGKDEGDFQFHMQRGMRLTRHRKLREARRQFEQASRLAPEAPMPHYVLAKLLLELDDPEAAVREFSRLNDLRPAYPGLGRGLLLTHLRLGYKLLGKGDSKAARGEFLAASRLRPEMAEVRLALADVELADGKVREAEKLLRAVQKTGLDSESVHLGMARIKMMKNDLPGALVEYEKAMAGKSRKDEALAGIGLCLLKEGKPGEAETVLRKALRINPKAAEAYLGLGDILLRRGNEREAITCYQNALRFLPPGPPAALIREKLADLLHEE